MIHKYKLGGYNIVLDVNSGGVHVVDELTYDLLDNVEPPFEQECPANVVEKLMRFYDRDSIISCYKEIVELYEQKILFSPDTYERYAALSVAAPVKAMCLLVAMDCNLRCDYCFAGTGDYKLGRKVMSYEVGKKALDYLLENSGDRDHLEVDFFGGEPLINWKVVKQLVEYGRSREAEYGKKFRFTVTTNGVLLDDEKMDFINKEMSNVVMSIDGRKEVTDRMRHRLDGKSTYDKIVPLFKELAERRGYKDYYVRGTFTKYNLDFSDDVFHLHEIGFDQISVEPVVGDREAPYAITEKDLPKVFAEYERLTERILENDKQGKHFNFFHFMIDLDQGPCAIKRLRGCGCGNDYVAITPDGDIYPCHQFVGKDEYHMGNILTGEFDNDIKKTFAGTHIYNKPDCKQCWARFYCSGGCNANNYEYMGDISKSHKISCEIEKKRLECAIMIKAAHAMEED
ncbi:MAG: thioether cross-link-forming SCIFF peptide maturase [Oscillospiraceae bacterium]|nr:thioether cross-link-forming SCIFF peptide maturase [Oscillospiraceae bacterium]